MTHIWLHMASFSGRGQWDGGRAHRHLGGHHEDLPGPEEVGSQLRPLAGCDVDSRFEKRCFKPEMVKTCVMSFLCFILNHLQFVFTSLRSRLSWSGTWPLTPPASPMPATWEPPWIPTVPTKAFAIPWRKNKDCLCQQGDFVGLFNTFHDVPELFEKTMNWKAHEATVCYSVSWCWRRFFSATQIPVPSVSQVSCMCVQYCIILIHILIHIVSVGSGAGPVASAMRKDGKLTGSWLFKFSVVL